MSEFGGGIAAQTGQIEILELIMLQDDRLKVAQSWFLWIRAR